MNDRLFTGNRVKLRGGRESTEKTEITEQTEKDMFPCFFPLFPLFPYSLVVYLFTKINGSLCDFAVTSRGLTAEMIEQFEPRAPFLPARGRFSHDRFDPRCAQRLGDLFHLARAAFAVFDD